MKNKKEQFLLSWNVGMLLVIIGFFVSIFANAVFEIIKSKISIYIILIISFMAVCYLIWLVEKIIKEK
jgi:hypothetical protein